MLRRRDLLIGGAALAACRTIPSATVRVRNPTITHGIQVGDVSTGTALVWARCDEPARMVVEWDTSPRFSRPRRIAGTVVTLDSDHTGIVRLDGLPAAQRISVRVRFEREAARGATEWAMATFATPGAQKFRVAWTGDTCGQGYGRNPEWGGLLGYAALRKAEPAFFVHSGDLIYADNPIQAEQHLADGRVWRSVTNEYVSRVAETLDDFRARFAYNLDDDHVRALAAEVPILAQWDDHETHNNWWPGQTLDDARYTKEKDSSRLAALARRAMTEWVPVPQGPVHRVVSYGPLLDVFVLDCRSFRTPNDGGIGAAMLGAQQAAWFVDALKRSTARWKLIACDQPLSLVIPDGAQNDRFEGWANTPGAPTGREVELAQVLNAIHTGGIRNLAWITADVHYTAAHHYDPARGSGVEFSPFWEFVAGPIHAGTFGPNALDPTFGPEVRFQWAPPPGTGNLAPWDGLQSFGTIDVSPDALAIGLWGIDGRQRFTVELPHEG